MAKGGNESGRDAASAAQVTTSFSMSAGFPERLRRHNASLVFSSYQSGALYFAGPRPDDGLHVHILNLERPMGLSFSLLRDGSRSLTAASGGSIIRFVDVLQPGQVANSRFDACFVPRLAWFTGDIDIHDVGLNEEHLPIVVNTRYNCLSTYAEKTGFQEIWRPPFISEFIAEDRCHLNGLAMRDGRPAYVTAISRSDTIDGWRDRRVNGGIVIDVPSSKIIAEGLSMPHSPRLRKTSADNELWVLNSGTGELGRVISGRPATNAFEPSSFHPGFIRGLAFLGDLAVVGLSRPRYKRFEGLALERRLQLADSEPWCGIQIVDLACGTIVDWLRLDGFPEEIYDLAVISGARMPMAVMPEAMKTSGPLFEAAAKEELSRQSAIANMTEQVGA